MYPWMDLIRDDFARYLNRESLLVIEPPWTIFMETPAFREKFSSAPQSANRISCWTVSGEPSSLCITQVIGDKDAYVESVVPHVLD
jgi:hypothetical protein